MPWIKVRYCMHMQRFNQRTLLVTDESIKIRPGRSGKLLTIIDVMDELVQYSLFSSAHCSDRSPGGRSIVYRA
jgi:hypothetical protein